MRRLFVFAFQATDPEFLLLSHILLHERCVNEEKSYQEIRLGTRCQKNFTDFLSLRKNHVISGFWWRTGIKISGINFSDHFSFSCFFSGMQGLENDSTWQKMGIMVTWHVPVCTAQKSGSLKLMTSQGSLSWKTLPKHKDKQWKKNDTWA